MKQYTDQHYIQKTLDGEIRAFSVLIERYQDFVYTVVVRILKVREEAEEIAQDAFLKAYESLPGYRGESKFSTWLYSIAYRKALDRLRKNNRMKPVELIEEITEGGIETIENALSYLEQAERNKTIERCIGELPEQDAAIIMFYYFEELSVKEIAEITELSADNIKIKLHRSRKKLFTLLKQFVLPEISETNGQAI